MRTLSPGDRGKEVSDVQMRLHALGYVLGREGVDGFFGPRTQRALKTFQQARGLLADGILGPNTWRELVEAGYALGDRLVYLRMPAFRGDDVLALQVKLNLLGFNAGPERGIFDDDVESAVIDFQRNAGLPVDGIVGEDTLLKLDALRKAESGREGKKIPDRHEGYAPHGALAGAAVAIDPGHGGQDAGVVSRRRSEGEGPRRCTTASAGGRTAARRGGTRHPHPGLRPDRAPLRARRARRCRRRRLPALAAFRRLTRARRPAAPPATSSSAATTTPSTAADWPTTSARSSTAWERRSSAASAATTPCCASRPRSRSSVEALFLTNPADEALAARLDYVEGLAGAVVAGLAGYLARR